MIRRLSILLQQLGGGKNVQFTVLEGGKGKLSEHLQKLNFDKKPIFLVIDNVFEVGHLEKLLPANLSKDLPACSVIAIACRSERVFDALLYICRLHKDNGSQVYNFKPSCLNPAESKAVFAACGGLSNDADADLLESLVPLCGGLPLALTVLGKLFAGNARRSPEKWELIKEQMEKLDGDDADTRPVTNALQVSYEQLSESRKRAFCEVVHCFYGWGWERVERILGMSVLNDLKESSLISEAESWSACSQSGLREGFIIKQFWSRWDGVWSRGEERVVTMHDLTLKFGEGLRTDLIVMRKRDFQYVGGLLQHLDAPKLRNLTYYGTNFDEGSPELEALEKAASLQTLLLSGRPGATRLEACSYTNIPSTDGQQDLRFLKLECWKSSRMIMEMKLSCEIREIHLLECRDVEQLPDASLHNLEVLSICGCKEFQHFPPSVGKWSKLKYLEVAGSRQPYKDPG